MCHSEIDMRFGITLPGAHRVDPRDRASFRVITRDSAKISHMSFHQTPTVSNRSRSVSHSYLRAAYTHNRVKDVAPLIAYIQDVEEWARTSPKRMAEHCENLMHVVANPMMLDIAQEESRLYDFPWLDGNDVSMNWEWLRYIQSELEQKTFKRGEYQKVEIPKIGKNGTRTIEVPPPETRIVARNLCNILTPIIDPDFHPLNIGFRPKRSVAHGIAVAEQLVELGLVHWVACDIRDAFGQLPKIPALQVLSKRLHDSPVMWLIKEIIDRKRKRGIPQGVGISPLMLNVYLDERLDQWWAKHHPDTRLVRYADDIMIACPSRESAVASYEAVVKRLRENGLKIKESQDEAVYDLSKGDVAEWLGFRIRLKHGQLRASIADSSWCKLETELEKAIVEKTGFNQLESSKDPVLDLVVGWISQKAQVIQPGEIPGVVNRVHNLGVELGLDLSVYDEKIHHAIANSQCRMDWNRDLVLEWLNSASSPSGSSSDADGVGSEAQLSPEDSEQFDVSTLPPVVIPGWPGLGNHGNGSAVPLASADSEQSGLFTLPTFENSDGPALNAPWD